MRLITYSVAIVFALAIGAQCQNVPVEDTDAALIAARSIAAITGGRAINDITLTGSGKLLGNGRGTVKLSAFGNGESRVEITSSAGTAIEIRKQQGSSSGGTWKAADGRGGKMPLHNCWTDAAWFFPALGSLAPSTNTTITLIGTERHNGQQVYHLHSVYRRLGSSSVVGSQELSAMDFFLDITTLLPVATTFYTHPDNNANTKLLVEVDFAGYRNITGVAVPTQIRRYQQGALVLELDVASASVN